MIYLYKVPSIAVSIQKNSTKSNEIQQNSIKHIPSHQLRKELKGFQSILNSCDIANQCQLMAENLMSDLHHFLIKCMIPATKTRKARIDVKCPVPDNVIFNLFYFYKLVNDGCILLYIFLILIFTS